MQSVTNLVDFENSIKNGSVPNACTVYAILKMKKQKIGHEIFHYIHHLQIQFYLYFINLTFLVKGNQSWWKGTQFWSVYMSRFNFTLHCIFYFGFYIVHLLPRVNKDIIIIIYFLVLFCCSVVPLLFCCSAIAWYSNCSAIAPLFRQCSVVRQCSAFCSSVLHCYWFYSIPFNTRMAVWLLLIFFICLHNQLSSIHPIITY